MDRTEVQLNHLGPEFLENRFAQYARLREECPVAFNTDDGGFWLMTGYEGVQAVAADNETFAHKFEPDAPDGINYQGIAGCPRPSLSPKIAIAETDGAEHHDLRRALNPFFTPGVVERSLPLMEAVATWFLDRSIEVGSTDLVLDYTNPVPAVLTLKMMGLPCANWEHYADFFHAAGGHPRDSPEYMEAMGHAPEMIAELLEFAQQRRRRPAEDLTSFLVQVEIDGRVLADEEIGLIMFNLVAGGLDTTTSLTSWSLHHLGTHPALRQQLIDDPSLLPAAIEEFLRFYSPNETLSRTATRDAVVSGQNIKRGDHILISWVSANHDPEMFASPEEIILNRTENRHLAFGLGGHRCLGSHIARAQARVILAEVLRRIPDYVVDLDRFAPYPANGVTTGVLSMPVTFTPGPRVGNDEPPF